MAGTDGRFARRPIAFAAVAAAMVVAAIVIAVWGTAFVSGDPLGYAVRLATEPLSEAMLHPPANKYLIAVPLVVYKGMFEVFGLDSFAPYQALGIALVLLCAGLLFAILRRHVGDLLAIPPTVLMLFFGPGWSVVLTPDRVPSQIALAAGLGMLLVLEREDLRGDVVAALLLAVSLASHPVGIAFAAAAGVIVLLRLPPDRYTRLWVVLAPGALFGAWWLFVRTPNTGSEPPGPADVLGFVADSWAALVAGITGLFGILGAPAFEEPLGWVAAGLVVVLIVAGIIAYWWRLPPIFWASITGLVVLMAATRLSPAGFTRVADEPRYLYPEAFLLLLALAGLAAGTRPPRWVLWGTSALLVLSLWPTIDLLSSQGEDLRTASDRVRARMGALEIAGQNAEPEFQSTRYMPTAREYEQAVAAYGGVGFTPAELASQSAPIRVEADDALVGALGLELRPASARQPRPGPAPEPVLGSVADDAPSGCVITDSNHAEVVLRSEDAWIASERLADAGINIGRFGDQAFVALTPPAGARAATLSIPRDDVAEPWRLGIDSAEPVTVCGTDDRQQTAVDAAEANLTEGDVPDGWETTSAAVAPLTSAVLGCLGEESEAASESIVTATVTDPERTVVSEVAAWRTPAVAAAAYDAFAGSRASSCLEGALAIYAPRGAAPSTVEEVPTPAGIDDPAIAFAAEISPQGGGSPTSRIAVVFFVRGNLGVLVSAISAGGEPFPPTLLSEFTETLERRAGE